MNRKEKKFRKRKIGRSVHVAVEDNQRGNRKANLF
tara:strand:- start:251 stop:355 length:105 start_codon:yes stop_codon:yes gene_type:complete